ncbi:aconitase/3-isopropylmalate dehydratase large subunit family protein [Chloroflexota bacterium]
MGKTTAEKILSKACGREVIPGEIVYPDPDLVLITDTQFYHDGLTSVTITEALKKLGLNKLAQPDKYVATLSHTVPITSVNGTMLVNKIRKIVAEQGIKNFFDEGRHGVEHTLSLENGLVRPGMLVFGGDTHMTQAGAVGALGIALSFELPTVFATGTTWIKVPRTIKVELTGSLPKGVLSRDAILWIIGDIGAERADYRVIEFTGPGLKEMGIAGRMTLCDVCPEIGAKSAIAEPDEKTIDYVKARIKEPFEVLKSDPDAEFEQIFHYDLAELVPMVAIPPTPDNVKPLTTMAGTRINQANLGSCANGTVEDLRVAAQILKGKKVHTGVRMIVCPATQGVFEEAAREGLVETFLAAGAVVTEPSCGICFGLFSHLAAGEACIATITRNDPGRIGSPEADIYLASPATVAASAIKGEITDPRELL